MSGPICLSLPFPPSANRLWRAVNGRQIKSEAYRKWMTSALVSIHRAKVGSIVGPYHIEIAAQRPDRRQRDLDNLPKAISDSLAAAGVIENDHLAQSMTLAWVGEPIAGGAITVTLRAA